MVQDLQPRSPLQSRLLEAALLVSVPLRAVRCFLSFFHSLPTACATPPHSATTASKKVGDIRSALRASCAERLNAMAGGWCLPCMRASGKACEHNILKVCACTSSAMDIHKTLQSRCGLCDGRSLCPHMKLRGGSGSVTCCRIGRCTHSVPGMCKACNSDEVCSHGKWRVDCLPCGGANWWRFSRALHRLAAHHHPKKRHRDESAGANTRIGNHLANSATAALSVSDAFFPITISSLSSSLHS